MWRLSRKEVKWPEMFSWYVVWLKALWWESPVGIPTRYPQISEEKYRLERRVDLILSYLGRVVGREVDLYIKKSIICSFTDAHARAHHR